MKYYLNLLAILSLALSYSDAAASSPKYGVDVPGAEIAYQGVVAIDVFTDTYLDGLPDGPVPPTIGSLKIDESKVVADGIYSSPYTGFRIRIPTVSGAKSVHITQALVGRRPDGSATTAHVVFRPETGKDVYALVTTRLRDDRPKDANSVLSTWEPRSPEEAAYFEANGVSIKRFDGPFGVAVVRAVRSREPTEYFPYRVSVDKSGESGASIGLTRLVVLEGFLYEFSLVVYAEPGESDSDLATRAAKDLDLFMGGLITKASASTPST